MTATGEDDDLISPQRFKAGEYSFEYAPDQIDVQPAPQLCSVPEPAAPGLQLDETLGDAMLGIVQDEDGEIDDNYDIVEALEANKRGDKEYSWVDEPEGGASSLKPGDTILFNFEWGWERGNVHSLSKCNRAQKAMAEEYDTPVLVRYVIEGDYIVQDFGGEDPSYLSRGDFDKLCSCEEEEESLEVGLKSWCIVKLE